MAQQHTETMYAMQLMGFGELDQLQWVQVPRPQPPPDEVLIRVAACGLNNTDLNLRKGWYSDGQGDDGQTGWQQTAPAFPRIQGADIVGEIVGVGLNVDASRIGQRVMVNPTLYREDPENPMAIDFIGSERDGGFAEYVCIPQQNAYVVETGMTAAELATFATSYLTAEHMLRRANIQRGETVLITGASGGVGSALIQLAHVRGAQVIAIVGRGKEHTAHDLGVQHIITRDVVDLPAALGSFRIDAVADVVGGAGIKTLMQCVREGGRIVTCGAIAGPLVEIDLRTLYLRHLMLIGSTLGTASDFAALVAYINQGAIKPLLAATYPLNQLRDAQHAFEQKQHFGKIVIMVADV